MTSFLSFLMLILASGFAVTAAATIQWVLLRSAMQLMRPATARRVQARGELAPGAFQVARVFAAAARR